MRSAPIHVHSARIVNIVHLVLLAMISIILHALARAMMGWSPLMLFASPVALSVSLVFMFLKIVQPVLVPITPFGIQHLHLVAVTKHAH